MTLSRHEGRGPSPWTLEHRQLTPRLGTGANDRCSLSQLAPPLSCDVGYVRRDNIGVLGGDLAIQQQGGDPSQ